MKKIIKLSCCLIGVFALEDSCKPSPSHDKLILADTITTKLPFDKNVSLVNLIATPEKYDKRTVRVKGFLNLEFEGNAVYLHKEDRELGIDKNALWIDIKGGQIDSIQYKNCNKQYVILEGTFELDNKGHHNGYSGAIIKISRIHLLK